MAARHLITLGHRDIAYIRTDREVTLHFSVQGRFDSFMTCCKSNGVEPRVFVTDEGKNNISKVVTQLLSLDHTPTAIACQEDGIANHPVCVDERVRREAQERQRQLYGQ